MWLAQVFSDLPKLTRTPRYGVVAPACKGGTHGSGRPCLSEARSVEILPSTPLEERSFQKARRTASPAREAFGGSGECGATPEFPDRAHGTRWATGLLTAPAPPLPRHRSNGELGATSQAPRAVSGSLPGETLFKVSLWPPRARLQSVTWARILSQPQLPGNPTDAPNLAATLEKKQVTKGIKQGQGHNP